MSHQAYHSAYDNWLLQMIDYALNNGCDSAEALQQSISARDIDLASQEITDTLTARQILSIQQDLLLDGTWGKTQIIEQPIYFMITKWLEDEDWDRLYQEHSQVAQA